MQKKVNMQEPENLIPGYLKGELSAEETKELINWIKSDSSNKRHFDECSEIWITAKANLKNPDYNVQEGFWKFRQKITSDKENPASHNGRNLFIALIRYAAIFIIAASLSGLLFYNIGKNQITNPGQNFSELVVPLGSRARFSLSDGTTVTLNAGSSLRYNNSFGINDRIVHLKGEGFFKVAKDPDRQFIVQTSHLNVMALGTAFNVKAYSEDSTIETTLIEGSVRIEGIANKSTAEVLVLKPNQKLTFFKKDSTMIDASVNPEEETITNTSPLPVEKPKVIPRIITENINVEPVISWKEDRWIFEKQSLAQIATDLERKFDVQIHFESERLKLFRFTGTIIAEPIDQVLEVMSMSAPISFKLKGRVVTLYENKNFDELNKRLYNQQ